MEFSLLLLAISILAGAITVFAPCIFTFLPVVLGSTNTDKSKGLSKALTIIISLAASVFIFSLLLRATTALISIEQKYWDILAGIIILSQGVLILFPRIWEKISYNLGFSKVNSSLNQASSVSGISGDILTGAALGPIFSSCSPTYAYIIGILLQSEFTIGLIYLTGYIVGLSTLLFAIALLGQKLVNRMKWGINPKGTFKRSIAILFVILGLLILTGTYKDVEVFIIENLPFLDATKIDNELLKRGLS